jgi:CHAT domain-containing protein/Tfp pilus assembly protein PilF
LAISVAPGIAQQSVPDIPAVFAAADAAVARGDPAAARREILAILSHQPGPAVLGAGAMRLSQIAALAGDIAGAEKPLQDALALLPSGDPAAQPALAAIYLQLGGLAMARGDMGRAQLALLKGIAIGKRVSTLDDPQILEAEISLAIAEIRAFRLPQAADRLQAVKARGFADTSRVAALYQAALGELFFRQYDYGPALLAQTRARDLFLALYGPLHAETARAETSLGSSLFSAGRYLDAERALLDAISTYDRHPDFYAPALASALVNLGQVYYTTGRMILADTAFGRAIDLARQSLGAGTQVEAAALLHRGYGKLRQNDLPAATADLEAAIALWSAPAARNDRAVAGAQVWLAEALRRSGNFADAETTLDQSAAVLAGIFGPDSYAMTDISIGRAELAMARSEPDAAVAHLKTVVDLRSRLLGADHIATLEARSQLALAFATAADPQSARMIAGSVTSVLRQRLSLSQATQSGTALDEVVALRRLFGRHVQVIDLALKGDLSAADRAALLDDSFALAQLARATAAGMAIAGLVQRQAVADPAAASDLRTLQETILRWQMAERRLSAGVAAAAAEIAGLRDDVGRVREEAVRQQQALAAAHPDLAALLAQGELAPAEVRAAMHPGESMLVYLTLEDRSYLWTITPDRTALVAIPADAATLQAKIRRLRETVNPRDVQDLSDILPYDVTAAAELHAAVIAPAGLLPSERHLIIVPDATLQSLPFAALLQQSVAPPAEFADYRKLPWLINDHDITILPEVGALTALRAGLRPSAAARPFFGIGDPVLGGDSSAASDQSSIADLLRGLAPLPESAVELADLAMALKAEPGSVVVGAKATEAALKLMPLADYRMIAFATHGLMAGDFGRLREPGLVLTPPAIASGNDDGLLTVGEIAQLKLDADWVVLSACNTAAGDGSPGAEGLSGLARAFFFAGSRALLVSQWEVLSVAALASMNKVLPTKYFLKVLSCLAR